MTRTDTKASSGPDMAATVETAAQRTSSRVPRRRLGRLAVPTAMLLALVTAAAPALAANSEGLSGYTKTSTTTTSKSGVEPTKTSKTPTTPAKTTPAVEPAPATTSSVPTTTPKASTLPFTGFDLRWTVGGGLLLMAMGCSIVILQRRERRGSSR